MTSPAVAYRERLDRGELAYQACGACGGAVFYPLVIRLRRPVDLEVGRHRSYSLAIKP